MGRRSEFTPAQKRDAVLALLTKRKTVSEVCREMGVSETSFPRRREKALAAMEDALADKAERSGREARLEAELAETQRALGKSEAIYEDRGAMMNFPPVFPDVSWRFGTRLPRDHYVPVDTNDYSVNPRFVGRRIEVRVTLNEVIASCEGTEVAHHRRCLAKHQTLLQPNHSRVLVAMRAEQIVASAFGDAIEERDLTDYDRALGVA